MPLTPPSTSAAPLSTSPPHDAKVRQIRRRVKDLSWKEGQPKANDQLATGDVDQPDDDSSKSISTKSDSEKEETVVSKDDPVVISSLAPVPQTEPTSRADTSVSSDSKDVEVSSNLKRAEVLDFAAGSVTGRLSPDPDACQGKRRREDEDLNPRDSKRITPPPDKDKENTEPAKATPKPVSSPLTPVIVLILILYFSLDSWHMPAQLHHLPLPMVLVFLMVGPRSPPLAAPLSLHRLSPLHLLPGHPQPLN